MSDASRTTITVTGMTCGHCTRAARDVDSAVREAGHTATVPAGS